MWKFISGISLTFCMFAAADDTPPEPSVSVQCCGRVRDGIVAIGCETTGTTITFNRMVWELQLPDAAARGFATAHNKEFVNVTGTLRRIAGTEVEERWIVDVKTFSERDATKDKEGTRLTIQGMLRATDPRTDDSPEFTIDADGQVWPVDLTSDATRLVKAESLVGKPVLVTGSLERVTEEDSGEPMIIRVKTLKLSTNLPVQGQRP